MKLMTFRDYVKYREGHVEDQFGFDNEGDDIDKVNHFMLLALADQDIRGSLYPILQQIAGQDETGEMQDLLKRIDINSLGAKAKKMLKMKTGNHKSDEALPDEDDHDRRKMVRPASADTGRGLEDEQGGGE